MVHPVNGVDFAHILPRFFEADPPLHIMYLYIYMYMVD